jgi:tetratricopeptide (TPR) repeat protein
VQARLTADDAMSDWNALLSEASATEKAVKSFASVPPYTRAYVQFALTRQVWPLVAVAQAMTGDFKGAHALIDKTPLDCDACLRAHGRIDLAEKNWRGAEYWFARLVADTPSLPFGYFEWGRVLLSRGDTEGAIAKFKIANRKSPHFADPLEMWGEALVARNRSDLALAKFAEAEKYAPNWGRLHLKWGEALWWSSKRDEAKKQLASAARLDLTPSEKAELAKVSHG